MEDFNFNNELHFNELEEVNKNEEILKSALLILHINIRSIKKNISKIEIIINRLVHKPDIVICSEAWLKEKNQFVDIPGYLYMITIV